MGAVPFSLAQVGDPSPTAVARPPAHPTWVAVLGSPSPKLFLSSPQRLPVPEPLPEPPRRLRGGPRAAPPPRPDLRRRQRALHHRHRGGVRRHRQVQRGGRHGTTWGLQRGGGRSGVGASSVLPLDPTSRRKKLLEYLQALKQPDGSFLMHIGGEVDVRWVSAPQRISAPFPLPNAVWGEPCGAPPGAVGTGRALPRSPQPPFPTGAPTAPPRWRRSPTSSPPRSSPGRLSGSPGEEPAGGAQGTLCPPCCGCRPHCHPCAGARIGREASAGCRAWKPTAGTPSAAWQRWLS